VAVATPPGSLPAGVQSSASSGSEAAGVGDRFAGRLAGPDSLQLIIEVAHDMRSPLGSILFLAERLRSMQSGPLTAVQERQIGLIYSAAFGLSALAGDVIELARGGEGLVHQLPVPFSVADVMQSVRSIVQPIAEEKGLTIGLVSPPADSRVGQPAALNRVLLNLTTNALKFTSVGSVEVVATQRSRTRVEFTVQDTGRGIPDEVMATLFEPFRRRDNSDAVTFSSAGLGLAISRQLVDSLGGDLCVTTSGQGTRFSFEIDLPLAQKL
jgi:signal transduction histidine kinase